jgi:aerobic carbon-monoxide dehydrogenase medium subunit
VKPAPFAYVRAETVEHALDVLASHGEDARVLAGGQSLVPLMNMRRVRPRVVVDITRVHGLSAVRPDGAVLRVGALVTQLELERHGEIDAALAECLPYTGHYVTRHRGTIGGSIAHGEPRGELALTLLALGGSAHVRSRRGEREVPAEELYLGAFRTSLAADELIVETRWPRAAPGDGHAFAELAQRHGDLTLASAACSVHVTEGKIVAARVAVGAVADRPLLLAQAAGALEGRPASAVTAQSAGEAASAAVEGYDDLHASAAYRRRLAGVLVAEAVGRALERAGGR